MGYACDNGQSAGIPQAAWRPLHFSCWDPDDPCSDPDIDTNGDSGGDNFDDLTGLDEAGEILAAPPNADTEGYTAEYDKPTKTWTLTADVGPGSDTDTQNPAPQGTKWTLTIGTEVEVEITQGSEDFDDGDTFKFSVFTSEAASTGYKKNEVATGYLDVTDGP